LVRFVFQQRTGVGKMEEFITYQSASANNVAPYDSGGTTEGPGNDACLFMGEGWSSSLWNQAIIRQCLQMFNQALHDPNWSGVPQMSSEALEELFNRKLKEAHGWWAKSCVKMVKGRLETTSEVNARLVNSLTATKIRNTQRGRKERVSLN
jgi:hypothetical protein